MSQSRTHSAIETVANLVVGYTVNFTANMIVLPAFGYHITVKDNLMVGVFYTVVSVARSYTLRRVFNLFRS